MVAAGMERDGCYHADILTPPGFPQTQGGRVATGSIPSPGRFSSNGVAGMIMRSIGVRSFGSEVFQLTSTLSCWERESRLPSTHCA